MEFELPTLVAIGIDCTCSCKSSYHAITTSEAKNDFNKVTTKQQIKCNYSSTMRRNADMLGSGIRVSANQYVTNTVTEREKESERERERGGGGYFQQYGIRERDRESGLTVLKKF